MMGIKTKPFNPFDYMETQAEIDAYFLECFNDENPQLFINALGHLAKHHGMAEVAKASGLNRESLYKAFNGKTQPKWDTVHRLMKVLHVNLTVAA
ncbi:MAG: addiction module antidote protein [Sedimenticola sp.]